MDARKINMWASISPVLTAGVAGLLIGGLLGFWGWGLAIGLCLYQLYFLWSIQRFKAWYNKNPDEPPPAFEPNLNVIASNIYQVNRQEKLAHQQTVSLVQKVRDSLSALQDSIILIDKNDCIEWWNNSAERLFHFKAPDQGRNVLTIIRHPLFHQYYHHIEDYPDGVRIHSPSNIERYVQCKITKFGQEKLLLIYDVTRFQHLEQMRKDFVANVSHELRTPLTVIMGYVETLSEQPELDPRIARAFTQMMQQSQRMNNIINDLLLLSRLENDEKPTEPKDIDIPKMLMQLFDDAQMYNKSYDHMIHLHIDSTLHILGYEDYLRSALSNLITNAMKYTPKGGEISISWHECDAGVCFSVTDNGIGIEQRHIQRLTERFYRVDTGRSRDTGGTGLGLAIVKHVLYQHHATLDITSTVGKGSTFTVTFPKSASIPTQALNPASPQS